MSDQSVALIQYDVNQTKGNERGDERWKPGETQNRAGHSDMQGQVQSSQLCKSDKIATSKRKLFAL